jgi:predicted O-methyltransferase YrrM
VTAERDGTLAAAAAELFADDPDVDVLHGDWREVLPAHAPFDLLFVDGGRAKDDPDAVIALAAPGATIVMDDFSGDWERPDLRRERWLAHPRLAAVEIGTGDIARVIVAVVRR